MSAGRDMSSGGAGEGYVKFAAVLEPGDLPGDADVDSLNGLRTELFDLGLVGVRADGVGFGNVSVRYGSEGRFVVSGTRTGGKRVLHRTDYCLVDSFDPERNEVRCTGRVPASSEAMSHGSVYRASPETRCVVHAHSRALFDFMLGSGYPRTPKEAAFGTPEIARAIEVLVAAASSSEGIFATEGHEEGVFAYGRDCDAALRLMKDAFVRMRGGNA